MNIKIKTKKTYNLTDMTEQQAQDLLNIATNDDLKNRLSDSENETLSAARQALLTSGLQRGD